MNRVGHEISPSFKKTKFDGRVSSVYDAQDGTDRPPASQLVGLTRCKRPILPLVNCWPNKVHLYSEIGKGCSNIKFIPDPSIPPKDRTDRFNLGSYVASGSLAPKKKQIEPTSSRRVVKAARSASRMAISVSAMDDPRVVQDCRMRYEIRGYISMTNRTYTVKICPRACASGYFDKP